MHVHVFLKIIYFNSKVFKSQCDSSVILNVSLKIPISAEKLKKTSTKSCKTCKEIIVKIHNFSSLDFAQTEQNCLQSHDCMTATFRISVVVMMTVKVIVTVKVMLIVKVS